MFGEDHRFFVDDRIDAAELKYRLKFFVVRPFSTINRTIIRLFAHP